MQQLPDWIIRSWWDAFCYMAGRPCGCCSGPQHIFFFFFFSCVCAFLTVKRKEKKVKRFFFFFPAQAITALLGSSRLLPWQLPVNIPAEFFLSAEERAPLFSATDKSIGHSWRKCKGRRGGGRCHTCTCWRWWFKVTWLTLTRPCRAAEAQSARGLL